MTKTVFMRALGAFVLGGIGGAVFLWLRMPLPWMLGAMTFTAVAALAGARPDMPRTLRNLFVTVLGVLLGSAFTPAILGRLAGWGMALAFLLAFAALVTWLGYRYFTRFARFDPITAFFASPPGGLGEMVVVGEAMGADARRVALVHGVRVYVVVMAIPLYFRFFGGYDPGPGGLGPAEAWPSISEILVMAACGAAGWLMARRLALPAAHLLGPLILSAIAHLAGLSEARPPQEAVALAQIAIGAGVGARFIGYRVRDVGHIMALAAIWNVVLVVLAVAASLAIDRVLDIGFAPTLLMMAPGGLAEMTLIALALGIDVAFVSTMHILRITAIAFSAPMLFRRLGWRRQGPDGSPPAGL
ncbi:MAG: AbrB family transcriptional regulator [Alphaproteobacteria bacterium]|nr:AbrB family transcriptional regulator [Alphaproteobacteria bacterium]